jgi:hypothetical protein
MRSSVEERSLYLQLVYSKDSDTASASLSNFRIEVVQPPD